MGHLPPRDERSCAREAALKTSQGQPEARARFRTVVETELAGLHDGKFSRYKVRPSEFAAWRTRRDG